MIRCALSGGALILYGSTSRISIIDLLICGVLLDGICSSRFPISFICIDLILIRAILSFSALIWKARFGLGGGSGR